MGIASGGKRGGLAEHPAQEGTALLTNVPQPGLVGGCVDGAEQLVVAGAWSGSALPSTQSAEAAHASIAVEAATSGRIPAREVR